MITLRGALRRRSYGLVLVMISLVVGILIGTACAGEEEEKTTAGKVTPVAAVTVVAKATPTPVPPTPTPVPGVRTTFPKPLGTAVRGGALIAITQYGVPHLDPYLGRAAGVSRFGFPAINALVNQWSDFELGDRSELRGELASRWEVSSDLTQWTFHIRQGVKFQNVAPVNGREMTADDVKFSYDYYRQAASNEKGDFQGVKSIDVVDKYTVRITLNNPDPAFVNSLSGRKWVIARELIDTYGSTKEKLVGTGPFILEEFVADQTTKFRRNPDYWEAGLPYLDNFTWLSVPDLSQRIALFRTGKADIFNLGNTSGDPNTPLDIIKTNPEAVVIMPPHPGTVVGHSPMHVRLDKPPFNNPDVRRAISMAIDRDFMYKDLIKGFGVDYCATFPWGFFFDKAPDREQFCGPYYKYDPAGAKQLLAKAGYKDGFTIRTPFVYWNYGPVMNAYPELVKQDLAAIGVKMDIKYVEYADFTKAVYNTQYEDGLFGCQCGGGKDYLASWVTSPLWSTSPTNIWKINNPEIDEIAAKLKVTLDVAEQRRLAMRVWEIENDQVYRIFLPYPNGSFFQQPWVQNYHAAGFSSGETPMRWARLWRSQ